MSKFNRNAKPKMGILPIAKTNQYQGNIRNYIEVARRTFGADPEIEIMVPDEISDITGSKTRILVE